VLAYVAGDTCQKYLLHKSYSMDALS